MLSSELIGTVLKEAVSTGGDFAELFVEDTYSTLLKMINGYVDDGVSGRDFGIGLRIFRGTRSVYAYTNRSDRGSLLRLAQEAASALDGNPSLQEITLGRTVKVASKHSIRVYPRTVAKSHKVEIMRRAHSAASEYDSLISQVTVNYMDIEQKVMIANTEGLLTEDERVRTRLFVNAIASKDGEKQSGSCGPGRHMGWEMYEQLDIDSLAKEAARIAVTMLKASYAPGGRFPVVIDNGFGGVIFHEACGHSLEATSVAKGTSVFAGKLGEQIASDVVTAVDDGTIPHAWGSQNMDDEGIPTRRNVLIEKGILKSYLIDRLNGRRMGMEPTGNSRRQSYRFAPTSRMTNTFITNGPHSREDLIAATEYGLYARNMGGGSVNPTTGEFNFAVTEGYMIRNGKIAEPVRGATLIGRGADVLQKIDMVADNLETGQGMCGSVSGSVPTDVGQPTIRVAQLTVGGRKEEE